MSANLSFRLTKKSKPVFNKVKEISELKYKGIFSQALVDILLLGIQSYNSGKRAVAGEVMQLSADAALEDMQSSGHIFNEVAETIYMNLIGIIADTFRFLKQDNRDTKLQSYLLKLQKALWKEKTAFNTLSNKEIFQAVSTYSPIIKQFSSDNEHNLKIIIENKDIFNRIVMKYSIV